MLSASTVDHSARPPAVVVNCTGPTEKRVPELDGVRAVAIWIVLLAHVFFFQDAPLGAMEWLAPLRKVIGHGWSGVDLFFVLSGFLITGILLDTRDRPRFFRNFYGRRALRILPVYLVTVLVMSVAYVHGRAFLLLSAVFLANMAELIGVSVPHGAIILWSLAVEEHFYLIWPWLVRFAKRRTLVVLATAVVLLTPLLRLLAALHGIPFLGIIYEVSVFRFDGLALGALLAIWYRSRRYSRTSPLLVILALLVLDTVLTLAIIPFGGMQGFTPVGVAFRFTQTQLLFTAGMIGVLAYRGTNATILLRSRVAVLSGELSYCIYLIHMGVLDAYMALSAPRIEPFLSRWVGPSATIAVRVVVVLIATFTLALISRRYLERPFFEMKRRFA